MRTTIDIPDPLYRKLKAKAAENGCSVKELILHDVEQGLAAKPRQPRRAKFPIVPSRRKDTLHLTNEQIYELIPFP
jgi:hypothetical protein